MVRNQVYHVGAPPSRYSWFRTGTAGRFGTEFITLALRQADILGSEPTRPAGSEPSLSRWRSAKQIFLVPNRHGRPVRNRVYHVGAPPSRYSWFRTGTAGRFGTEFITLALRQADILGSEPARPAGSEPSLSRWRSAKQIFLVPNRHGRPVRNQIYHVGAPPSRYSWFRTGTARPVQKQV